MWFWLSACTGPEPTPGEPPPPYSWEDTAVYTAWDTLPAFTGPVPRNLLMISIDTLRRDHVGRYGGDTPFLDSLFTEGVALDDHLGCSNWTFVATTCALSGRTSEDARHMPRLGQVPIPLPQDHRFLADWLGDAGYHSILVSDNLWLGVLAGNARGYDAVTGSDGNSALDVWRAGADLLQAAAPDRWFLHLHLMEPHASYAPPERYLDALDALPPSKWNLSDRDVHYDELDAWPELSDEDRELLEAHLRARYAAEVRYLDDQLRDLFADAEARGWLDDTLVVLWSDHGEAFWEHGHQTHAYTLHAEENDTIGLLWSPTIVPLSWEGPTSSIDLVPTLLHLYGLPIPDTVTGVPLGAARPGRTRFASTVGRAGVEQTAVRDVLKLRYHWSGTLQLFDRIADPAETRDVWDASNAEHQALWDALRARVEALDPLVPDGTPTGI